MITTFIHKFREDDGSSLTVGIHTVGHRQYVTSFLSTGEVRCVNVGVSKGEEYAASLPKYISNY